MRQSSLAKKRTENEEATSVIRSDKRVSRLETSENKELGCGGCPLFQHADAHFQLLDPLITGELFRCTSLFLPCIGDQLQE
ncbi:hypothetical protein [Rhizobium sullae]|uniref:hypothetical protein n=1 Tax=Rhizobium sullae TaxID=50338 RepID=UPI00117AFE7B|nr:hypothetical protein [Rhizobium sullae]